jgi:acyl carrier protein
MMQTIRERVAALSPERREQLRERIAAEAMLRAPATRLVAFVQWREGVDADVDAVKAHLAAQLPAYMLPAAIYAIDAMPHTPNGKIDRQSLATMAIAPAPVAFVAPRDAIERTLAGIWSKLLGMDDLSINDDFFELGGHSLLVTRAIARINDAFGMSMPVSAFFAQPTIAGLADFIRARTQPRAAEDRDTFEL